MQPCGLGMSPGNHVTVPLLSSLIKLHLQHTSFVLHVSIQALLDDWMYLF
jgi:hypothetical protein